MEKLRVDNLRFSEVFLILLAEIVLAQQILSRYQGRNNEIKLGSESFAIDIEAINLFREDITNLDEIGRFTNLKSLSICQCKT